MQFISINDPINNKLHYYWRFNNGYQYEKTWHGPFNSIGQAKSDANKYGSK